MEAEVAFVAMAADARGGPGLRDTIAAVPAEYGTSKGWRFNDCRATPGGAIFAGRCMHGAVFCSRRLHAGLRRLKKRAAHVAQVHPFKT